MRVNLPVKYSQFDPQWKDKLLGFNTDPKYNFYNYGCLQSCLASICKYFGKDDTPALINDKLIGVGGFVPGGGLYVHGTISKIYPDINQKFVRTPEALTNDQISEIRSALDSGLPVMINIDYNPKTIARDDHFVVIVDYNPNDENDFTIYDPLGGIIRSLKNYLGFFKGSARKTIESYSIFTGQIQHQPENVQPEVVPPTPEPAPSPAPVPEPEKPQGALPPNYNQIVHGSTQWDETVKYLEIEKQPSEANFEDAKRKIAGFKSSQTDYFNKKIEAEKEAERAQATIENQKKEISSLKDEVLRVDKLRKAEIDSIKSNTPTIDKFKAETQAVISDLTLKLKTANDEASALRIELANKTVEDKAQEEIAQEESKNEGDNQIHFSLLYNLLKRFVILKW